MLSSVLRVLWVSTNLMADKHSACHAMLAQRAGRRENVIDVKIAPLASIQTNHVKLSVKFVTHPRHQRKAKHFVQHAMQGNICLLMERPKSARTALLVKSARMVHLLAKRVEMGSTQMQQPKLPVVLLAALGSTVIKIFKTLK
jgi:hypothetical protein